jgi:hypothetical protein
MRRVKISDHAVFRIILICIAVCGGYLTAWTLVDPPAKEDHEADEGPDKHEVVTTTVTGICTFGDSVYWVIGITVAEIVGLLYGSMLAYQNRDIHDAFSESKWTGIAIYNMMVQMVFVSAMSLLFKVRGIEILNDIGKILLKHAVTACVCHRSNTATTLRTQ